MTYKSMGDVSRIGRAIVAEAKRRREEAAQAARANGTTPSAAAAAGKKRRGYNAKNANAPKHAAIRGRRVYFETRKGYV